MPCEVFLRVDDTVVPTVICKDIAVSVDGQGNAMVCASDFASANDNCGTVVSLSLIHI